MEAWVIVNPAAGRGRVGRFSGAILKAAREKGAKAFLTEGPGHASYLAKEAPEGARVVAVGGDGTVHEVLSGVAGTDKGLGVVPIGSGNDFARMLRLRKRPWPEALEHALFAPLRAVDLAYVNGLPFGAFLGIGLDALVAKRALTAPPFLRGMPRYLFALALVLKDLELPLAQVQVDGEKAYEGPALLFALMNAPTYGGGIPIAPMASPEDGLLHGVLAGRFSRLGVLGILPRLLLGRHLGHREVRVLAGRRFGVRFDREVEAHADGEPLGAFRTFQVELRPLGLLVVGEEEMPRRERPALAV